MKQHRLITVLSAALLGLSAAASLPALPGAPAGIVAEAATTSNGREYTVENGKVTITGYTGTATSISIPSSIGGRSVTKIGKRAFRQNQTLTAVTLPGTLKTIDSLSFASSKLKNLNVPSSVETIGNYAFQGAASLKTVVMQGGPVISQQAFQGCSALQTLEIKGAAQIGIGAFRDCTAMTSAKLHKDTTCTVSSEGASGSFNNCTSLNKLNGELVFRNIPDPNGSGEWYPVITSSLDTRKILRNVFQYSKGVKFMTDYTAAISNYIVTTEIRDWMSDNVKARVLYDWLIEHCAYEDDPTKLHDAKNHSVDGLFLSYGTDDRGPGVGETVCEGYAMTYTTLLAMAGVESYVLSATAVPNASNPDGHAWNLVKIEDKYYECDVTWERDFYLNNGAACNYGKTYQYFLLDSAAMANLHRDANGNLCLNTPRVKSYSGELYLNYDQQVGNEHLAECIYNFNDTNYDGLLDWDWNFDGTADWNDLAYNALIRDLCNVSYVGIESQPDFLHNLLIWDLSPELWYFYSYNQYWGNQ